MLSDQYKYYPKSNDLTVVRSSGSTGQYLKYFWDRKDLTRSNFLGWIWRKKYYNITPQDKYVSFHSVTHINNKFINDIIPIDIINEYHTSLCKLNLSEEKIQLYLDYIKEFNPVWIHTQPSIMVLFYEYLKSTSQNFPNSVKYFESTGEYLDDKIKSRLCQELGVKIANNYGCREANYIACECSHGNMHILEDNVFVEILDNHGKNIRNGRFGTIVITSKINHAVPLIRYNTGDIGRINTNLSCPCGCRSPIIELMRIRNNKIIKVGDQSVSCYTFLYAIEKTNEQFNNPILQYKVTQISDSFLQVQFVIALEFSNWKETIRENFIQNLPDTRLQKMNLMIEFVPHIYPDPNTGKLQFFDSLL